MVHFAHSRPDPDRSTWQELTDHLESTGRLAQEFAPVELRDLARVAGHWHDVGKYQEAFQRYIGAEPELSNEGNTQVHSVPHAAAGAALAVARYGPQDVRAMLLALVIEAHHGALKAVRSIEDVVSQRGSPLLAAARRNGLPPEREEEELIFQATPSALAVRMLFSAVVDADLLDTERWDRGVERAVPHERLEVLRERLIVSCDARIKDSRAAAATVAQLELSRMRQQVYESCIAAASRPRGAFTLTVPTGGGKTLSGLAFALTHAVKHGMRRVLVVAPYTSILEQTAQVYRDVLGAENVIEHHSSLAPAQDTDRNRRACENWDAPVIVTTSVQLLESLHAAHKAPCRKLHCIADSVVLLDEVQTFPSDLLLPIHAMLKRLVNEFGVTVVHGTATQPLLTSVKSDSLRGLQIAMQEIMPEPKHHFATVRDRFRLERLGDLQTPLAPEDLAAAVRQHKTALAITHRRADAELLATLIGPECLHLSAAMCAEHRSDILHEVRRRLKAQEPCLLVSTQLIEAGVDIDFPVVFRAMAGLETLAQAAGRCNRELRLEQPGRLIVYRAGRRTADGTVTESEPPRGSPQLSMRVALTYFEDGDVPDLSDPELFPRYARRVFNKQELDKHGLLELEKAWDFPAVAAGFRMIDEATISVVAPYVSPHNSHVSSRDLVRDLQINGPTRERFRALQRFTVGLREHQFDTFYAAGWLEPVLEKSSAEDRRSLLWTVRTGEGTEAIYDQTFGFLTDGSRVFLRTQIL